MDIKQAGKKVLTRFRKKEPEPERTPRQKAADLKKAVAALEREAYVARAREEVRRSKERVKAERAEAKREIREAKEKKKAAEREVKRRKKLSAARELVLMEKARVAKKRESKPPMKIVFSMPTVGGRKQAKSIRRKATTPRRKTLRITPKRPRLKR